MELKDAQESLTRRGLSGEQLEHMERVTRNAEMLLQVMYMGMHPSPELTLAARKLEEAVMWHTKALKARGY